MSKPHFGAPSTRRKSQRQGFAAILGEMDDSTALAILALHPSIAQIGNADWMTKGGEGIP